jgi:site-specific DNA-cytosine methylase
VSAEQPIPVIDLFAGPGGLGEGFSALTPPGGSPVFRMRLSIKKDPVAHKTLELRAFFRQFRQDTPLSTAAPGISKKDDLREILRVAFR